MEMNDIKKFGFGTMRLPKVNDQIDIEQTKIMFDRFMEAGFNYFDTAYAYPGSEEAIKEALVKRYPRESYFLTTKCAAWDGCKNAEEAKAQIDISLERAGVEYFDLYLLHNIGEMRTHFYDDFNIWDYVKELKENGKIKHYGFSFHSSPEELEDLLNKHPDVEVVQLQINYADWNNPNIQSKECYDICVRHGKKVIVMEPVKGGMLANPPKIIKDVFDDYDNGTSYASWGIKFAANLDNVLVVLSGMSNIEQVEDNLKTMKNFNGLTKEENEVLEKAMKAIVSIPIIGCTGCNYCANVCPQDIGISIFFKAMNIITLYDDKVTAQKDHDRALNRWARSRADQCIKCGACESVCPQHLPIRDLLEKVVDTFEK